MTVVNSERLTDKDLTDHLEAVNLSERWITEYEVKQSCSLKEFIETKELIYRRGLAFYEFTHEKENISAKKKFILMNKVCIIIHVPKFSSILSRYRST